MIPGNLACNDGVGSRIFKNKLYHIVAAAAAKLLQSCPTPSDPMDCSLPGSSIHAIFQARVLEWVAIAFSNIYAFMKKHCYHCLTN